MYSLGSANPEGGSKLLVFKNGIYAILYFGGIQAGQWKFVRDNVYQFTPADKGVFELYGRQDKNLQDQIRISFNGFENGDTFVFPGEADDKIYSLKRVFNEGANGFSYPYVHNFKTKAAFISFLHKDFANIRHNQVTFKIPKDYNDFVAFFAGQEHEQESRPFSATFKDNRLYLEEGRSPKRLAFSEDDEEIEEIRSMAMELINREILYLNPSYNHFEEDIDRNHVFDEQKGAYIDEEYYQEGEELLISDQSFDSMAIIYAFKAVKNFSTETIKYEIDEGSIFIVNPD
jgi:hypothetical protein